MFQSFYASVSCNSMRCSGCSALHGVTPNLFFVFLKKKKDITWSCITIKSSVLRVNFTKKLFRSWKTINGMFMKESNASWLPPHLVLKCVPINSNNVGIFRKHFTLEWGYTNLQMKASNQEIKLNQKTWKDAILNIPVKNRRGKIWGLSFLKFNGGGVWRGAIL